MATRYAHINIIAQDWCKLCSFYEEALDCTPWSSERDHQGPHIDTLTGLEGIRVQGRHLRVPGHSENGPTIEIFTFSENGEDYAKPLNRPGFAHVAFEVDDIDGKREQIKGLGGSDYGDLVTIDIAEAGKLSLIYMADPEGNIVELQKWHNHDDL